MATRTLNSPGVEIRERDLSLIAPQNVGTNVFIAGYANQGPTDEVLKITTRDELEAIYGVPTNSAERYFYHGIRELLNSPANIYTSRLPYGAGAGAGFGSNYSALAYPARTWDTNNALSGTNYSTLTAGTVVLGAPVQVALTEDQYRQALEGSLFTWSTSAALAVNLKTLSNLGGAAIIILNKSQSTIDSQFQGYYVGLADNLNINPATSHTAILGVKTVSVSADSFLPSDLTTVPTGTLQFNLSSTSGSTGSVSYLMENLTDYDIDGREDDDLLNIAVLKLRKSLYSTDAYKLDYVLEDKIVGSIDFHRQQMNQTGGPAVSFFLESQDYNSRNVEILVNPYVSNRNTNSSMGVNGIPTKKIRLLTTNLVNNAAALSAKSGLSPVAVTYFNTVLDKADNLYPLGAYSSDVVSSKVLGSIPSKLERSLEAIKNDEIYDIDVLVEAGLGTIHAVTQGLSSSSYDDTVIFPAISTLQTSGDLTDTSVRSNYSTIFNVFENFCNLPSNTGGRGDCMFIADPIRHLLITGKNTKVLSDRNKSFQQYVYWGLRHQFELENTSYAAGYANWAQIYDEFLGDKIWVPFSPVAGAAFARNDAAEFPWSAPAGYTRGLVSGNVIDIAITPNQKQRDELYKSNLNPVLFSPSQGMAIFGQKTFSRKPSAFDRINVRRLFLALERPTKKAAMFYVFEPNNEFTRTRFINTLSPIFEYAKQNGGLYDYLIVCDERNNTPDVIDANEMKADIYIKPTRTAEFIIVQFTALRSETSFEEIIGQ